MYITVTVLDLLRDIHVNRGTGENEERSVVYWDAEGHFHSIDLAVCAENYARERGIEPADCTCVGERNILEGYFEFWTSGIKTRIVFPKCHRWEWKEHKRRRFHAFQRLLTETGYSTLDLT